MTYTTTPKTSASYTKGNKFEIGHLLMEDGAYLLYEDGGKIQFYITLQNFFTKISKTIASWSIGVKP